MFEKITIRIFFICLASCASLVLIALWQGDESLIPEYYFKTVATFFIIGLASFLSWFVSMLYSLRTFLRA
jgi:hypothetical protein